MIKNICIALFVASAAAAYDDGDDFIEEAANSQDIDFNGNEVQSLGEGDKSGKFPSFKNKKTKSSKKTKITKTGASTSDFGGSFVTPAITPWSTRAGQRPAKVDYPVPNFGLDHDIKATHKHEKDIAKKLKVKWNPKQDKKGKWIVPTVDAFFKI